jgi:hypothetical protein
MIVGIVNSTMRTGIVPEIYRYYQALLMNEILLRIIHD